MMQQKYGRFTGWGAYVPEKCVTNFDLEKTVDTTNEWIIQRTGIHTRYIAKPEETTATMSVEAGRRAMKSANVSPDEIDLVIVATTTPDYLAPSVASQVQHMLGITAPAFTLMTGCTGFVYAVNTAQQFIRSGAYQKIIVIGTELLSRFVDWSDRSTSVLFGDGAGAVVIEATDTPSGILGFDMGSDGSKAEAIIVHGGGSAEPVTLETIENGRHYITMNGREVFKFATRIIGPSCQRALDQANMTLDQIDWIVPHQANLRIIKAAAREMGVSLDKFIISVDKFANTSAASIPMAMVDALNAGKIKPNDTILLCGFGAGLTWASAVVQLVPVAVDSMATQEAEFALEFAS